MSLLRAGLAEVLRIQRLDCGVLMRLSYRSVAVDVVKHGCALSSYINRVSYVSGLLGLSAAVYAAAGACHNLYELIVSLSALYALEQLLGVCKS